MHSNRRILIFSLTLLTAVNLSLAGTSGWSATFPSSTIKSSVQLQGDGVIVAAAGTNRSSSKAAGEHLSSALRESGISLVMTDEGLGEISGLDDKQIIDKCSALPVNNIMIVRVFPGSDAQNAVIMNYNKKGDIISAFNATEGKPLGNVTAPSGGISKSTMSSVGKTVGTESDALKQYKERVIWKKQAKLYSAYTGHKVSQWEHFYQGTEKDPLLGSDLYRKTGKIELAETMDKRSRKKAILQITNGLVLITGLTLMIVDVSSEDMGLFWTGLGLSVVPVIAGIPINAYKTDPATQEEKNSIVDDYNKNLRQELGINEEDLSTTTESLKNKFSIALVPKLKSNSVGANLVLSF